MVKTRVLASGSFIQASDWRASYHLSLAAALPEFKQNQCLKEISCYEGIHFIDGWRFSDNPSSDWYLTHVSLLDVNHRDPLTQQYLELKVSDKQRETARTLESLIQQECFYRMRHISDMRLVPESQHYLSPFIEDDFCVKPGDVVVRRVGSAGAAFVTEHDGQHPIDANMAIIRGLEQYDAVWLTFCLQQPLYLEYLEQNVGGIGLVRVGLSQLKQLPIVPKPYGFEGLAEQYLEWTDKLHRAQRSLNTLRKEASDWVDEYCRNENLTRVTAEPRAMRFDALDIDDRWSFGFTERHKISRELLGLGGIALADLAVIEPKIDKGANSEETHFGLVKISHLQQDLSLIESVERINIDSDESNAFSKVKKRPVEQNDVLVSTFVKEGKLAWVNVEPDCPLLTSDHLATLRFHQYTGAYVLMLETEFVQWQLAQLVTGTVQAFINNADLALVVMPPLPEELAEKWHDKLESTLTEQRKAKQNLKQIQQRMLALYNTVHPEIAGFSDAR